jgi:hypothetical protein
MDASIWSLECETELVHQLFLPLLDEIARRENEATFEITADSDEVARAFRNNVAQCSETMSPECDASLAGVFWHWVAARSIVTSKRNW